MIVNFSSSGSAEVPGPRSAILGVPAEVILETLPRFGAPRFVLGNAAVRVEQATSALAIVPGGALIMLCDVAEIWPRLAGWGLTLAVAESDRSPSALSFRFFDGGGRRVLEAHVVGTGHPLERARACVARWRSPWSLPPHFDARLRAVAPAVASSAGAAGESRRLASAFQRGLRRARRSGCDATVRQLEARHGRTRLETLSLLGGPWAQPVPEPDLWSLFEGIARRGLDVRLVVANPGATYVRRGRLPPPRRDGAALGLRGSGVDIEIDAPSVAQVWAVRLRAHHREVTAIEAFDAEDAPAFSIVGARDAIGTQAAAWTELWGALQRGQRSALDS